MTHSVLSSFDPLATHPFTNNSGLLPKPAAPSKYPLPIPTSRTSAQTSSSSTPIHAPQPSRSPPTSRSTKSNAGTRGPIFVPFRPERSSPDLEDILLKKELDELAEQYPSRFSLYYVLNNPPHGWQGGVGFVTKEQIEKHLPSSSNDIKILLCGPPPMMIAMKYVQIYRDVIRLTADLQLHQEIP